MERERETILVSGVRFFLARLDAERSFSFERQRLCSPRRGMFFPGRRFKSLCHHTLRIRHPID